MKNGAISFLFVSTMLSGITQAAYAQDQTGGPAANSVGEKASAVAGDIIVTATKRAQSTVNIPSSITALGGEDLQDRRVLNLKALDSLVPGLQFSSNNASSNSVYIRGVGHNIFSPAGENSVAVHLDGVYLANSSSIQSAFFDVERVEVLRGPQGSLYGRNATGGAINIISKEPTSILSGYLSGTVANYARTDIEGAVGGPIAGDTVTGRIGGYWRRHDGYGENHFTGNDIDALDEWGGKASLKLEGANKSSLILRADYYRAKDSYGGFHYVGPSRPPFPGALPLAEMLGGQAATDVRDANADTDNLRDAELWGVSATGTLHLSDSVELRSLTGFRHVRTAVESDLDGTPLAIFDPFRISIHGREFSQEAQLHWKTDRSYLILGGYYFASTTDSTISINTYLSQGIPALHIPRILPAPFGVFDQRARSNTHAEAVFANLEFNATDHLTLTGGLRYSHETKGNRGFNIAFFPNFAQYPGVGYDTVDASRDSSGWTPTFSARYAIGDNINIYGTVSRGFKSGEWITGTSQYARPEFVWTYEAGLKGSLFDRRFKFSLAAFYYDFTDLQVQRVQTPITILENAPGGKIKGGEGEFTARLPEGFSLDGNFTVLDTKIVGFVTQDPNYQTITRSGVIYATRDLTGNRFPYAPKFSFNLGLTKAVEWGAIGKGDLRFDVQYSSLAYLDVFNSKDLAYQPARALLNASYTHSFNSRWSATLWAKNLTDRVLRESTTINAIPNLLIRTVPQVVAPPYPAAQSAMASLNEPRTFGLTVRYGF